MTNFGNILRFLPALLLSFSVASCQLDRGFLKSSNAESVHIIRYDRIVDDYVNTGNVAQWQRMNTEFPKETRALIEDVLKLGPADADEVGDSLCIFYKDTTLQHLRNDVARQYNDLSEYEKQLSTAFERLKEEKSDIVVPKIYAQNSALNQSIVVGDSLIGISLDKYLGSQYPLYQNHFNANQRATMEPSRIVIDCLLFYLNQQYPFPGNIMKATLGDVLIHQGAIAWVVAKLVNKAPIDVVACQPATKKWYLTHEKSVWNTLKQANVWNKVDAPLVHSVMMTSDAHPYFKEPHSRGVGLWLGMRIVEKYMCHHPKVSLDSLLRIKNFQHIVKESKY